jgi:hypothetical protein
MGAKLGLSRVSGSKRDEVTGRCSNKKSHNSYSSGDITTRKKLTKMRWVGHAVSTEEIRNAYNTLFGNPDTKRYLQDLGVDGKAILKWISRN